MIYRASGGGVLSGTRRNTKIGLPRVITRQADLSKCGKF